MQVVTAHCSGQCTVRLSQLPPTTAGGVLRCLLPVSLTYWTSRGPGHSRRVSQRWLRLGGSNGHSLRLWRDSGQDGDERGPQCSLLVLQRQVLIPPPPLRATEGSYLSRCHPSCPPHAPAWVCPHWDHETPSLFLPLLPAGLHHTGRVSDFTMHI